MTRRLFLKLTTLAAGFVAFLPATAFAKKVAISLDKLARLQQVGGWTIVKLKGKEVLFVRDADASVRAFTANCTHQQCPVGYDHGKKKLVCPCHGSTYSLEGVVEIGPAPANLTRFDAQLQDGRVIVDLGE